MIDDYSDDDSLLERNFNTHNVVMFVRPGYNLMIKEIIFLLTTFYL